MPVPVGQEVQALLREPVMIAINGYQVKGEPKRIRPTEEGPAFPSPSALPDGRPGVRCSWECQAGVPLQLEDGKAWLEIPVGWWIVETPFSTVFHCPDHPFDESLNTDAEETQEMRTRESKFWGAIGPWLNTCPIKPVAFSVNEGGLQIEYGPLGREAVLRMIDTNSDEDEHIASQHELTTLRAEVVKHTGDYLLIAPRMFDVLLGLAMDRDRSGQGEFVAEDGSVDLSDYVESRVGSKGHMDAFMTIWVRLLSTKEALAKAALNPHQFKKGRGRFHTYRSGTPSVGRNDKCPCGSGKKFKKCCS
jgi:hypothetical protein